MKRIIASILAVVCLLSCLMFAPASVNAVAVDELASLTCGSFISNVTHREYIDTMMRYYISANASVSNALDNGKSAIFMFEGGSDNYNGSGYSTSGTNIRNQAVCIVVQKKSGSYQIVFYDESSSSIPSQPKDTTGSGSRQTTLMDGIYTVYSWNHQSKYGALQVNVNKGYYTPPSNPNGLIGSASGINLHTRTSAQALSGDSAWSWGCQLIGYGNNSSNSFNAFMKAVTGITYNVWNSWGSFNTISTGTTVGYYILDRQLALGGLSALYNSTALANITVASKTAYTNATADYLAKCSYYPSHCEVKTTKEITAMKYPCTAETDSESTVIATLKDGHTVTGTALFKNTKGEYWYRITCYGTTPAYIYAGDTEFIREIRTDVRIENSNAPSNIPLGNVFAVQGEIKTTYNLITGVSAYALNGFDTNGSVATGGRTAVNGYSYSLKGSDIDNALEFNKLSAGNYTYVIWMNVENHHAISGTEKQSTVTAILIKEAYFTVGGSKNIYTVMLNANGGLCKATSLPKTEGVALALNEVPTREGYEFSGWSESQNAATAEYKSGSNFTADKNTTLYAVWEKSADNPDPKPEFGKLGDINDDGDIDQYDYILAKRIHFKNYTPTAEQALRGDVDKDGDNDQYDYILIKRHHFGNYTIAE